MFRHQKYLEIPWEVRWHQEKPEPHHHLWWLMALLLAVLFLIGVGIASATV